MRPSWRDGNSTILVLDDAAVHHPAPGIVGHERDLDHLLGRHQHRIGILDRPAAAVGAEHFERVTVSVSNPVLIGMGKMVDALRGDSTSEAERQRPRRCEARANPTAEPCDWISARAQPVVHCHYPD